MNNIMKIVESKFDSGDNPIVLTKEQHIEFRKALIGCMRVTFEDYPRRFDYADETLFNEAVKEWHKGKSSPESIRSCAYRGIEVVWSGIIK